MMEDLLVSYLPVSTATPQIPASQAIAFGFMIGSMKLFERI